MSELKALIKEKIKNFLLREDASDIYWKRALISNSLPIYPDIPQLNITYALQIDGTIIAYPFDEEKEPYILVDPVARNEVLTACYEMYKELYILLPKKEDRPLNANDCPYCSGRGYPWPNTGLCSSCAGSGWIPEFFHGNSRVIHKLIDGDIKVSEDLIFNGFVKGNIIVVKGGLLRLYGRCFGNLILEEGATVHLFGDIDKNVHNIGGNLQVYGSISGDVVTEKGGNTGFFRDRVGVTKSEN